MRSFSKKILLHIITPPLTEIIPDADVPKKRRRTDPVSEHRYPDGTRMAVFWPDEDEWFDGEVCQLSVLQDIKKSACLLHYNSHSDALAILPILETGTRTILVTTIPRFVHYNYSDVLECVYR